MTTAAGFSLSIENPNKDFNTKLTPVESTEDGVEYLEFRMTSSTPVRPEPVTITWQYPMINTHHRTSTTHLTKLGGMGTPRVNSRATANAPVFSMFDIKGRNKLTFAISDAINACELQARHAEETARCTCNIILFQDPLPPMTEYSTMIRFDSRDVMYFESLSDVSDWWAKMPEYKPAPVPEPARLPMYSTWYSFHLGITPDAIEEQCRLAKELGMDSVIVDDGWQTDDKNRGYAYCGDWEAAPSKFPDFRAHVDKVHALGMKYLLWFSVPFVGVHTKAFDRFKDKFLTRPENNPDRKWFTLDPRFPDVREYLIGVYERCVREFDLDGFKLDFVDCFGATEETKDCYGDGRDYASVPDAADRLLTDVMARLREIKPDIMIEFRQSYIGPVMRKYGNIFRVGDEPNYFAGNRIGAMLLRALSGNTSIHSDMVMWHPEDSVESAAMQLLHVVFTVPQISVLLDKIPEDHVAMIRRYLDFWRENRDVLLDGKIEPLQPQHAYPAVISETERKIAAAAYANGFVPLPAANDRQMVLINGTFENRIVLETIQDEGDYNLKVWSCTGNLESESVVTLGKGVRTIDIPPAGTAVLTKA